MQVVATWITLVVCVSLPQIATPEPPVSEEPNRASLEAQVAAAARATERGAAAEAVRLLESIIAAAPTYAPAWIELAAGRRWAGDADGARAAAERAVTLAPDHPLPYTELARAELARGQVGAAVAAFRAAIARQDSVALRAELASLLARQRRPELALQELDAALALAPDAGQIFGAKGRVLYYSKEFRAAASAFAEGEARGLRDADLVLEHGRALESLAELAAAMDLYARAKGWFPGDPRFPRRLGALLVDVGRPGDAIALLALARDLAPDDAETHERLGLALLRAGRSADAVLALRRAIDLAPDTPRAHYELAQALLDLDREAEATLALAAFDRLRLAQEQRDHRQGKIATLNRQGLELYRAGNALAAVDTFTAAIQLGPKGGAVHANLALALLAVGNLEGATRALEEAMRRDGDSPALAGLAEAIRVAQAAADR